MLNFGCLHVPIIKLLLRRPMRYQINVYVMSICAAMAIASCSNSDAQTTQNSAQAALPAASKITAKQRATKIVFLGDSLTAGFGLPQEHAWPEQVQKRLKNSGFNTTVVNAGVSGDNSANGLARYDWSVGSAKADMLVLALGANDFLQGVSPDKTRANLAAIIERAQKDGLDVVLAGVSTPQLARLSPIARAYGSIYPDLAREYNIPLFPSIIEGVSGRPNLLQTDGLHPTRQGVEVMADNFATYLEGILNQTN